MGLEHLADVHARRHAQRVEHDFHRRSIGQERHVFLGHDLGDHTFVAVTARHLVTDRELALRGDEDLDLLDDAGIDVVAGFHAVHFNFALVLQLLELGFERADDLADLDADRARVDLDVIVDRGELAQERLGDLAVGRDDDLARLGVDHVERNLLVEQDVGQRLGQFLGQRGFALGELVGDGLRLALGLGRGQLLARGLGIAGGDLDVHHDAVGAGGKPSATSPSRPRLFHRRSRAAGALPAPARSRSSG